MSAQIVKSTLVVADTIGEVVKCPQQCEYVKTEREIKSELNMQYIT